VGQLVHMGDEKCIESVKLKILREETNLGDLGINRGIILK